MRLIVCALLSAALYFVSASLIGFWPAAWLAPVPILWLAYAGAPAAPLFLAAFVAFAAGQGSFAIAYHAMLPPPLLAAAIAIPAFAFAASIFLARFAVRRLPALPASLLFPAAATAIEFVTALVSPHGTFGSFAYSQVSEPHMIQSAAYFGLWSITFLLAWFASLAALTMTRTLARGVCALLAGAVLLGNFGFGYWQLSKPDSGDIERIGVAAIDSLAEDGFGDDPASARRVTNAYADAVNVLAGKGATTAVLPEKIAILRSAWREQALAPLKAVAAQTGVRIVAGFDERGEKLRNTALTINPDGTVISYYKRHLIPGLERHVAGNSAGLLGNGLAVAICKDLDFPATIRGDAKGGARLMFVPAWDFGADGDLHARMAILRGVENGFAIARAAREGLLTLSDALGRSIARAKSDPHGLAIAVADLPKGRGSTLYTRIGDAFAWAALALALALTALSSGGRRRIP